MTMQMSFVLTQVFLKINVHAIEVTAKQSIKIFGMWDQPRRIVTWDDIKSKKLTWRQLRKLEFKVSDLKNIQPCKHEWIQRGCVTLHDLKDMVNFPVNPIADMHADIGEIWSMEWTADDMRQMGLTYEQLKSKGLTIEIMKFFNMPLSAWVNLGFKTTDIVSGPMSLHVFGMEEDELRKIICDYV